MSGERVCGWSDSHDLDDSGTCRRCALPSPPRLDYEFSVWPREGGIYPEALFDTFRNANWHGRQSRTFTCAEWIKYRDEMDRAHFTLREVECKPAATATEEPCEHEYECHVDESPVVDRCKWCGDLTPESRDGG